MTEVVENEVKLTEKSSGNPAGPNQNTGLKLIFSNFHTIQQPTKHPPEPNQFSPSPQPPQQPGPFLVRPPLNRVDSRQNFQYRPPFPNNQSPQGPPLGSSGPQSIGTFGSSGPQPINTLGSTGPQSISVLGCSGSQSLSGQHTLTGSGPQSLGSQVRPQQGVRQPAATPQFVQRGPPLGPGGTPVRLAQSVPASGGPYPQNQQQQRPIYRPQTPYPRPPLLAQRPQVFQQSSVPAFNRPRPHLEDTLYRSQTLDSSEIENQKNAENSRSHSSDQRPPSAASLGRSFSVSSSNPTLEHKKSHGSNESINISRQSSMENVNVYKKPENEVPSRPESRSASRMDKIAEGEDKVIKSRPESRGSEETNGEVVVEKSPKKETIKDLEHKDDVHSQGHPDKDEFKEKDQKKNMELKLSKIRKEGDNDSGVDESTQGNDQSCNGDSRSPRKSSKTRTSSTTPTTGRSLSRGSKTPSSLQSPDSTATTPGSAEKKKVPMNKIHVGSAPSPNLKVIKSKIGSLENAKYKPGGGKVKIESKKLDFKNAGSRIEAKNEKYTPKQGEKKIVHQKLEWNAKSKIGSLDNASYKPKGCEKKIETVKLDWKAKPKVGSKDNIKHMPGGGDIKIENRKIELHATSKIASLDNVKYKPGGGEMKIFDDKDYLKQRSDKSSMDHSLSGSQNSIPPQEPKAPVADENLNQEH